MSAADGILEMKVCSCGLKMTMSKRVPDVGACINCDGLQPQELQIDPKTEEPYKRIKSPWDKEYEKVWEARKREFYPEQYKGKGKKRGEGAA